MTPVQRTEIVDYQTWEDRRSDEQPKILLIKKPRRVHLGEHLTLLFENRETIRYQVQEMMRVERLVREEDIVYEIETYNGILGRPGELGCTLLIEITDKDARPKLLREWLALPEHLYALLEDGTKVRPTFDESQRGEERLASVQYLKFEVGPRVPVAVGSDLPALTCETRLTDEQRAALAEDLGVTN